MIHPEFLFALLILWRTRFHTTESLQLRNEHSTAMASVYESWNALPSQVKGGTSNRSPFVHFALNHG
jgi:hypothetical protein